MRHGERVVEETLKLVEWHIVSSLEVWILHDQHHDSVLGKVPPAQCRAILLGSYYVVLVEVSRSVGSLEKFTAPELTNGGRVGSSLGAARWHQIYARKMIETTLWVVALLMADGIVKVPNTAAFGTSTGTHL